MLTIRPAAISDIQLIRNISFEVWPKTYSSILTPDQIDYMMELIYSEASLQQQMAKGHQFVLVYDDEQPVGFASFNEIEPGVYKLQKIYVSSNLQGKGTGKYLMDHIINLIKPKGATALRLNVNRHNKARYFYERLGFGIIAEEDIDIGNGYFMNDYVMEKKI